MTSLVSWCARIVNQNKWPTLLHDRADVTVGYVHWINICFIWNYLPLRRPLIGTIKLLLLLLLLLLLYKTTFFQKKYFEVISARMFFKSTHCPKTALRNVHKSFWTCLELNISTTTTKTNRFTAILPSIFYKNFLFISSCVICKVDHWLYKNMYVVGIFSGWSELDAIIMNKTLYRRQNQSVCNTHVRRNATKAVCNTHIRINATWNKTLWIITI